MSREVLPEGLKWELKETEESREILMKIGSQENSNGNWWVVDIVSGKENFNFKWKQKNLYGARCQWVGVSQGRRCQGKCFVDW